MLDIQDIAKKVAGLAAAFFMASNMGACTTVPKYDNVLDESTCNRLNGTVAAPIKTEDDLCYASKVANILLSLGNPKQQAVAVAVYDMGAPEHRKMIDRHLAAQGTTMEELRSRLPQVTLVEDQPDGCQLIHYKMPESTGYIGGINKSCPTATP